MNISVENISHTYKGAERLSINELSLKIKSGTKHGIFGSNGAGKSTLIKIICNVISPTSGTVVFNKKDDSLNDVVEVKQSIGYVPQDFAFYEELTLLQNAKYFGTMFNLTDIEIQEQYDSLVSVFGLKNVFTQPAIMSQNMKTLTFIFIFSKIIKYHNKIIK